MPYPKEGKGNYWAGNGTHTLYLEIHYTINKQGHVKWNRKAGTKAQTFSPSCAARTRAGPHN